VSWFDDASVLNGAFADMLTGTAQMITFGRR
jgi:hypothetical protein